ncbi:UPF0481 protein At3g47200-like [Papaver somniferum]|uniref:UPF0481 protein At3g47200-like n=1 Tax=Papaver somniferum TaxID=3469 RepID=UPI000E6FC8D8|nr:UPF0481 protein At3g47200-like [Papaver somniferum]
MATKGDNSEILADHPLFPQAKNEQLSISVEEMITKFDKSSDHIWRPYQELICIHRVHEKLHKMTDPSSYAPLLVSIGPFHRGKESLEAMEECKLHYMSNVLNRTREEHNFDSIQRVFKNCVESVGKMEEKIRQSYSEPINLESKELIEMMVVDGLFIIGIFQALTGTKLIDDKFLFHNIWAKNTLLWDLLLMENQIPIFVLERLFNITAEKNKSKGTNTFQGVALNSFKDNIELPRKINAITKLQQAHLGEGDKHLLDLVAKSMNPDHHSNTETHAVQISFSPISMCTDLIRMLKKALLQVFKYFIIFIAPTPNSSHKLSGSVIPSATELARAGVTFEIGPDDGSFLDVKFDDGVMRIPRLVVGINTGRFFRNLIASEQYFDRNGSPYYMTSYAIFMDNLVSSPADVTLLRNQGIITHTLGTDDDVCNIFNKLCSDIYLKDDYYADIHKRVNIYYCDRWNFCKATLSRTYFDNPWAGIYLVAATLFFLLSLVGVIIRLLEYIKSKK